MRKKVFLFLIILFFVHLSYRIFLYRGEYLSRFDPQYWEYRYLHSQWVIPDSKESIGDDGLYAYAGWKYINGADPSLINPEIPPLGKYLIGLSIVFFGNQNIFALLIGLLSLSIFYLLNVEIFKDKFLAFIPVCIFSLEPLFYEQLRAPFLDLLLLTFLFLTFRFFIKKRFFLTAAFLGCMAATKFSFLTVLVVILLSLFLLLKREYGNIKKFLVNLLGIPITFSLFYTGFFLSGHTIREFLGLQKFIVSFYATGAKAAIGIVFPLLLTGNWHTWFAGLQWVNEWNLLWPISFLLSVIAIFFLSKEKKIEPITLIAIWIIAYLLFLSFIPATPRYLLLLLPFMYNLAIWVFSKNILHRQF